MMNTLRYPIGSFTAVLGPTEEQRKAVSSMAMPQ